jgi:hypothetical protein
VLSVLFSLSWFVALFFSIGPMAGLAALVGCQLVVTAFFLGTAIRLRLDGTELWVGRRRCGVWTPRRPGSGAVLGPTPGHTSSCDRTRGRRSS